MKKTFLIVLCSATLIALSSCGNGGTNSTKSEIQKALEKFNEGVTISGTINEKARFLTASSILGGVLNGDITETQFDYVFKYENKEMTGIERLVTGYEADGSSYVHTNDIYAEGDDGYLYFLELNYKNEIEKILATDSAGFKVNYGSYFDNPFYYLNEKDFTKIEDGEYSLNLKKASYLASQLFGDIDPIFYSVIESATAIIENDEIKSITLKPTTIETYETINYENVYFLLDATATLTLSNMGNTTITKPTPKVHKTEHDALGEAFKSIKNNYTLTLSFEFDDSTEPIVSKYFYTEDAIYGQWGDGITPSALSDVLLVINDDQETVTPLGYNEADSSWSYQTAMQNGFSSLDGADKNIFIPIVSEVAPEIFNYDANSESYKVVEELKTYIGAECFIPSPDVIRELDGYGTGCEIFLKSGLLDRIEIGFNFNNGFTSSSGKVVATFSDLNTTILPFGITLE